MESVKKTQNNDDPWMLAEDIPDIDFFFSGIWLRAFVNNMENSVGTNYSKILCKYNGFNLSFYYGKEDSKRFAQHVLDLIKKDPRFGHMINQKIYDLSDKLVKFSGEIKDTDLKEFSDEELWTLFELHDRIHTELYEWGWLPNAIDMFHPLFTDMLITYLEEKTGSRTEANKAHITLTQPTQKSILAKFDDELFKIGAEIEKDPLQIEILKKHSPEEAIDKFHPENKTKLEKYWNDYGYLNYMWLGTGPQLKVTDYIQILKDCLSKGITLSEQAKENDRRVMEDISARKQLFNELSIDKAHQNYFNLWGDFMLTKIYRRNAQIKCFHEIHKLLEEIAKRCNITLEHVRFMHPDEVKRALIEKKIEKEILDKRMKFSVYYAEKGYDEMFTGEAAIEFASTVEQNSHEGIEEVKGQVACMGKVTGKVKIIIRAADMAKFEEGDILVSIATDPDVVPAMKKAAAIVTEQGGVTSHAAIVSRELDTPCIIGTKIATKVFKDGDMVEVDANKGVVKRL